MHKLVYSSLFWFTITRKTFYFEVEKMKTKSISNVSETYICQQRLEVILLDNCLFCRHPTAEKKLLQMQSNPTNLKE